MVVFPEQRFVFDAALSPSTAKVQRGLRKAPLF